MGSKSVNVHNIKVTFKILVVVSFILISIIKLGRKPKGDVLSD